jgi:hypothetical protein
MRKSRLHVGCFLAVCLLTGLAQISSVAQQRTPERQQGPPVKRHQNDIESSYLRFPIPPGEEAYKAINGERLKTFVNEFTEFSRKSRADGEYYWGRIAGSKYTEMAEKYVEQRFKEFGLKDIRMQPFDLPPQWIPRSCDLKATGSGKTLTFSTAYPSGRTTETPASGMNLDAVWVGIGTELDFAGRDVKGKLAVIHSVPSPSAFQHSANFDGALRRAAE